MTEQEMTTLVSELVLELRPSVTRLRDRGDCHGYLAEILTSMVRDSKISREEAISCFLRVTAAFEPPHTLGEFAPRERDAKREIGSCLDYGGAHLFLRTVWFMDHPYKELTRERQEAYVVRWCTRYNFNAEGQRRFRAALAEALAGE